MIHHHLPTLWHSVETVTAIRSHLNAGHPHATALLKRVLMLADEPFEAQFNGEVNAKGLTDPVDEHYTVDCAVAYLLTGNQVYAQRARLAAHAVTTPWPKADLSIANRSFFAAIVHQCCAEAWSESDRFNFESLLARLALGINQVRPGNPYQVGNNWWAVTHSGALIAALSVHNQTKEDGSSWDLGDVIERCKQRLITFCHHFGDAGLYHEGLGYQTYACSNLIPALLALRNVTGEDIFKRFPTLLHMAGSLNAISAPRYNITDENSGGVDPCWGTAISWNDAGQGWPGTAMSNALLALTPDDAIGSHVSWYDRLTGHESPDQQFGRYCGGRFYAAVCYPYTAEGKDPERSLPKHVCDSRQGLWVVRDRYHDKDDAVLGAYARATHVGGHSHNDAGSVRLMALDHDWIIGGGQARGKAEWQSSVTDADEDARKRSQNRGLIMWDSADKAGAHMAMDLRWNTLCYNERYVGVRWATDESPLSYATLDILEHKVGKNWWWSQVFASELECTLHDSGFELSAQDGTRMRVQFLGHQPDELTTEKVPESKRTYASGDEVTYPGRPYVRAVFGGSRDLQHIYAVSTISRGNPPPISSIGKSVGVEIGESTWHNPFGAAIPNDFILTESRNLCQFPSGKEDWDFPMDIPAFS